MMKIHLEYTRRIVANNAQKLVPWPDLWPSGPDLARDSHRELLSAIGLTSGATWIDDLHIHTALDEWVLTDDRNMLTGMQRAVCGVALLEMFLLVGKMCDRVSPNVMDAIYEIGCAINQLSEVDVCVIYELLSKLITQREALQFSVDEESIIRLAIYIIEIRGGCSIVDMSRVSELSQGACDDVSDDEFPRLATLACISNRWLGFRVFACEDANCCRNLYRAR